MTLSFFCAICGIAQLWALLMLWGFSAGPIHSGPFVALVGCFVLSFAAAPFSLFMARLGAVFALLGGALMLAWPVAGVLDGSVIDVLPFMALPIAAIGVAGWRLWRTRESPWLTRVSKPSFWIRLALCGLPFALFVLIFNVRAVIALLLAGPPNSISFPP
jgi:hypothetical protein